MGERLDDDGQHHRGDSRRLEYRDRRGRRWDDGRIAVRQPEDRVQCQDDAVHIVDRGGVIVGVGVGGGVSVVDVNMMRSAMAVHHQVVMVVIRGLMDVRRRCERHGNEAECQHARRHT